MAEAALQAGDLRQAQADLAQGFAFVEQSGERYYLADLHRLSGQLALRQVQPNLSRAEACFAKAIDVAHGQHGRLLELRAANDLARLWREGNSNNDMRALIEPILAEIEGGEAALDVREARELLAAFA
jgi:predicted ATPase